LRLPQHGSDPPEGLLEWAERKFAEMNALLSPGAEDSGC
jgi:hypothetical protein